MGDMFERAPKVELHLHLEGAVPLKVLWEVIAGRGDPEVGSLEDLRARFAYRDFPHFIDTWWWMTDHLRTADDFTLIAEAVARSLAAQNIVYAETSFSPTDFERHGLTPQVMAVAIRSGLDRVPETSVVLNVDLVRDAGPQRAERTLDAVLEVADQTGIRGITIGGSEQDYPPEPFADVYRRAALGGLRLTAHAGEAAGPESVWGAIRSLGVERIGHGVRSVEDPRLVEHLVEHRIPLEICPTSNLRTGVAAGWDTHPVTRLLAEGAVVTISTDDPALFHCDLAGELRTLAERIGTPAADPETLTHAAISSSGADDGEKRELTARVTGWWAAERSGATGGEGAGFSTS
jgi:adenosine deaminase